MNFSVLPTVNAILNGCSGLLLIAAFVFIKQGKITWHRNTMLAATALSILFITSYLTYHYNAGSTLFQGTGGIRYLYFAILLSHTVLAMVNLPMVIITLKRGLAGVYPKHRKIARITLPIWLYISITGVIIYMMLYQIDFGNATAQTTGVIL